MAVDIRVARYSVLVTLTSVNDPSDCRCLHLYDGEAYPIGRASKSSEKNLQASSTNALFDCPIVSREHAELQLHSGYGLHDQVTILDRGSRHGTRVNGKPLARDVAMELRSGDIIQLGDKTSALFDTYDGVHVTFAYDGGLKPPSAHPATSRGFHVPAPSDDESGQDDDSISGDVADGRRHLSTEAVVNETTNGLGTQTDPIDVDGDGMHHAQAPKRVPANEVKISPDCPGNDLSKKSKNLIETAAPVLFADFTALAGQHRSTGLADVFTPQSDNSSKRNDCDTKVELEDDMNISFEAESVGSDSSDSIYPYDLYDVDDEDEFDESPETMSSKKPELPVFGPAGLLQQFPPPPMDLTLSDMTKIRLPNLGDSTFPPVPQFTHPAYPPTHLTPKIYDNPHQFVGAVASKESGSRWDVPPPLPPPQSITQPTTIPSTTAPGDSKCFQSATTSINRHYAGYEGKEDHLSPSAPPVAEAPWRKTTSVPRLMHEGPPMFPDFLKAATCVRNPATMSKISIPDIVEDAKTAKAKNPESNDHLAAATNLPQCVNSSASGSKRKAESTLVDDENSATMDKPTGALLQPLKPVGEEEGEISFIRVEPPRKKAKVQSTTNKVVKYAVVSGASAAVGAAGLFAFLASPLCDSVLTWLS